MSKSELSETGDEITGSVAKILFAERIEIAGRRKIASVGDFKREELAELNQIHYLFLTLFQHPFVGRSMEMFTKQPFERGIGMSAKGSQFFHILGFTMMLEYRIDETILVKRFCQFNQDVHFLFYFHIPYILMSYNTSLIEIFVYQTYKGGQTDKITQHIKDERQCF